MMTTIRLYSKMARMYGKVHRVDLSTGSTAEAVRYLRANFKGVDQYISTATKNGFGFAVFRGKENLSKKQLDEPSFGEDIRIAPVILGSKNSGVFSIILGAALIAVAAIATGGVGAAFAASGFWGNVAMAGAFMAVGGALQMLAPRPKGLAAKDSPEHTPSYFFNGAVNTVAQGHCVPILYGRGWVGSATISAGMDIKDDIITQSPDVGVGGGSMGGFYNGTNRMKLA